MRDECVVCFEETLTFPRGCCSSHVCDTCMSRHVGTQVTSGVWKITCPGEACGEKLEEDELLALLHQAEIRELYQRLKVDSNEILNTKTCPNCKYVKPVKARCTMTARYHQYGLVITCTKCSFDWCFRCHGPTHPNMTCSSGSEAQFQDWAGNKMNGEFSNAVQCPQCKTYVQHDGGCNNMTCTVCSKEFCYLCGDKACVHGGHTIFRRRLSSVPSIRLENEIGQLLVDLDRRQNKLCCLWFNTLRNWSRAAKRWTDNSRSCCKKWCRNMVFIYGVILLVLLFPIFAPVSMIIVAVSRRRESRQLQHRLNNLLTARLRRHRQPRNHPQPRPQPDRRQYDSSGDDDSEEGYLSTDFDEIPLPTTLAHHNRYVEATGTDRERNTNLEDGRMNTRSYIYNYSPPQARQVRNISRQRNTTAYNYSPPVRRFSGSDHSDSMEEHSSSFGGAGIVTGLAGQGISLGYVEADNDFLSGSSVASVISHAAYDGGSSHFCYENDVSFEITSSDCSI